MDKAQYSVGDVVRMKKAHPCGSYEWVITRTGIDFGLKCRGCGRFVMIPRPKFEKGVKCILESDNPEHLL
ncbi:MAG: DUF951 domain-containing protein [Negativicutes bacterium]|nr:DUF951 domain-containing protein [Negativicutes bacterium]